jgi:hypothetical protein
MPIKIHLNSTRADILPCNRETISSRVNRVEIQPRQETLYVINPLVVYILDR